MGFAADIDDDLQSGSLLSSVLTMWAAALVLAKALQNEQPSPLPAIVMVLSNVAVFSLCIYVVVHDVIPRLIAEYRERYAQLQEAMQALNTEDERSTNDDPGNEVTTFGEE